MNSAAFERNQIKSAAEGLPKETANRERFVIKYNGTHNFWPTPKWICKWLVTPETERASTGC